MKTTFLVLSSLVLSFFSFGQNEKVNDSTSKESYHNPIDNKEYVPKGGFKTYRGGEEVDSIEISDKKETKLEKVIFLSSDDELQESTTVEELKIIMDKVDVIFYELFGESTRSGKIMIQFELFKNKKNVIQFAVRDDLDLEIMKEFEKRILAESFPKSKKHPIKFQFIYKVNSLDDKI